MGVGLGLGVKVFIQGVLCPIGNTVVGVAIGPILQ